MAEIMRVTAWDDLRYVWDFGASSFVSFLLQNGTAHRRRVSDVRCRRLLGLRVHNARRIHPGAAESFSGMLYDCVAPRA